MSKLLEHAEVVAHCKVLDNFRLFQAKAMDICSCEGWQESCHSWSSERMTRQPGSSSKIGLLPNCHNSTGTAESSPETIMDGGLLLVRVALETRGSKRSPAVIHEFALLTETKVLNSRQAFADLHPNQ